MTRSTLSGRARAVVLAVALAPGGLGRMLVRWPQWCGFAVRHKESGRLNQGAGARPILDPLTEAGGPGDA